MDVVLCLYDRAYKRRWKAEIRPVLNSVAVAGVMICCDPGLRLGGGPTRLIVPASRRAVVDAFYEMYDESRARYPNIEPSVIAHGIGTLVLAQALAERRGDPRFHLNGVLLAGSLIDCDFEWDRAPVERVRNEIGHYDRWPGLLRSSFLTRTMPHSGSSGVDGFRHRPDKLRQEEFKGYGHLDFLRRSHCKECWIPFLRGNDEFRSRCLRVLHSIPGAPDDFDQHHGQVIRNEVDRASPHLPDIVRELIYVEVRRCVIEQGEHGIHSPQWLAWTHARKAAAVYGMRRR